jgi:LPS-assembly protein
MVYTANRYWTARATYAWDTKQKYTSAAGLDLRYRPHSQKVFSVGYSFVRNGDVPNQLANQFANNNLSSNLNRMNIGVAWPLRPQWSVVADWYYNFSHQHPQGYFYGVQYDTCCWALRVITSRVFDGIEGNGSNRYDKRYYFQIQFKGLANFENANPGRLLTRNILGYTDAFGN